MASFEDWRCIVWDLARGLCGESSLPRADDPLSVLKAATQIAGEILIGLRAERLDAIFFIDLPAPTQREQIWQLARCRYEIAPSEPTPADDNWAGAEMKGCCRLSALLQITLTEASRLVARSAAESITALPD